MDMKLGEREITFDFNKVSEGEWENTILSKGGIKAEHEVLAKCTGLTIEEIRKLSRNDYKLLTGKFVVAGYAPLKDPN